MTDEKDLLGAIGLCRGAGKAVVGVPMVCELLRKQRKGGRNDEIMVIEASDTSENTSKRLRDKCSHYNTEHIKINSSCEELGRALGKSAVAAVAVTDGNFCRLIRKKLSKNGSQT